MIIDRNTVERWLAQSNTGDILVLCDGNPDRLANRNAEFRMAFVVLKKAHVERHVYIDADQQGNCVARRLDDEFTLDDGSNIVLGKRDTAAIVTAHDSDAE